MINPISFGNINIIDDAKSKVEESNSKKFENILGDLTAKKDEKGLKEVCQNLESIFLNMIFKNIRNTIERSSLVDYGFATEMYEDMLFEKYSEEAAKAKGVGLAQMLYQQLSHNLESGEKDNVD